jgi:hypothetical protein
MSGACAALATAVHQSSAAVLEALVQSLTGIAAAQRATLRVLSCIGHSDYGSLSTNGATNVH